MAVLLPVYLGIKNSKWSAVRGPPDGGLFDNRPIINPNMGAKMFPGNGWRARHLKHVLFRRIDRIHDLNWFRILETFSKLCYGERFSKE